MILDTLEEINTYIEAHPCPKCGGRLSWYKVGAEPTIYFCEKCEGE